MDSEGQTVAAIEIVAVEVVRLGEVDDRAARAEGEGYSTAAGRRTEHERFRSGFPCLSPGQAPVLEESSIVIERLKLHRLEPRAGAR